MATNFVATNSEQPEPRHHAIDSGHRHQSGQLSRRVCRGRRRRERRGVATGKHHGSSWTTTLSCQKFRRPVHRGASRCLSPTTRSSVCRNRSASTAAAKPCSRTSIPMKYLARFTIRKPPANTGRNPNLGRRPPRPRGRRTKYDCKVLVVHAPHPPEFGSFGG